MSITDLYNIKRAVREEKKGVPRNPELTDAGVARLCGMCVRHIDRTDPQMSHESLAIYVPRVQHAIL